jgi:hypothetical protein
LGGGSSLFEGIFGKEEERDKKEGFSLSLLLERVEQLLSF